MAENKALKLAVLISGSGTNLQAIIDAIAKGELNATIEIVISSRPDAKGLARAQAAGIQTMSLSKDLYADPLVADEVIASTLLQHEVDLVVLAGYMRKVHAAVLNTFVNRVVNLHPALLPSFKGAHAIQDAYDAGVKVTGVTVHIADAKYDCGPIVAQRAVVIEEGWNVEDLEAHIHEVEHELLPKTLELFAEGKVHVVPGNPRVTIDA